MSALTNPKHQEAYLSPGLPIDVNRLFWFIQRHRQEQSLEYLRALDDLEQWLRDGGYEP